METNEIFVNDDVPETSEQENEIETNASEGVEEVQTTNEVETPSEVETNEDDIEKQIEERANKLFEEKIEARLARDRVKREREQAKENAKFHELETMMKSALGANNLDEVISKSREFYKEQGITIPEVQNKPYLTERQQEVLARDEARKIIELGKEEMNEEANRIAKIPKEQRTYQDNLIFDEVCKELVKINDVDSLKAKGYDTAILEDKDFSTFRNQFNLNTPVDKIYEMYKQVSGTKPVQPKSPGSAKTNTTNNEIKDYYTPEEVRQFTEEDLDNPKLMEAIDKSMLKWGKNK